LWPITTVTPSPVLFLSNVNTINIDGSDVRGTEGNKGAQSIISEIGNNFVRFRLGVGRSEGIPDDSYALESFPEANQEMDMFGYALDITGQALQHYLAFGDVKATKKKFGTSRKLPKVLRKVL
jgi:peptidyl-tRNA hydrolase